MSATKVKKPFLPLLAIASVGAFVGYVVAESSLGLYLDALGPMSWLDGLVTIFLLLPLSYFSVILIHELGHMLSGLALGFDFMLLSVGPFQIKKDASGRIKPYFQMGKSNVGGLSVTIPKENFRGLPRQFAIVVLAGPLSSLGAGAICFAFALDWIQQLEAYPLDFFKWAIIFLLLSGAISLFIGLGTILPFEGKPGAVIKTDGTRAKRLLLGGPAAAEEAALLQIVTYLSMGKPYRDIPEGWFADLPESENANSVIAQLRYAYALDKEDWDGAATYVEPIANSLQDYPLVLQPQIRLELVFAVVALKGNVVEAENMLADIPPSLANRFHWQLLPAKAALAVFKEDWAAFHNIQQQAVSMPNGPLWEMADTQRRWIALLPRMIHN